MWFKKPERKRFTGLGFERAGLGNYCGSGGEGTSERDPAGAARAQGLAKAVAKLRCAH